MGASSLIQPVQRNLVLHMIDLHETLRSNLYDPETGWSMGGFGAIAEFHQDADETLCVDDGQRLVRATVRGGIGLSRLPQNIVPVAYEAVSKNPMRWAHGVALCLPSAEASMNKRVVVTELGPDEEPLRDKDKGAVLFDMGLSAVGGACTAVDFCVRPADADLIEALRSACGRSIFDPESPAMHAILNAHPHRVALTRVGRVEVYQLIGGPATGGKSPPGPHTHVLPNIMRSGRTHSANQPIPDGFIPCAMMYPGNPLTTALGVERVFDERLHDSFQKLFEVWGRDEQTYPKEQARAMIRDGAAAASFEEPGTRAGRIALRVLCRQFLADPRAGVDGPTLKDWSARFDGASEPDPDDTDPTDVVEGEGH